MGHGDRQGTREWRIGAEAAKWLMLTLAWCVRDLRQAAATLAVGGVDAELRDELVEKARGLTDLRDQVARRICTSESDV